MLTAFDAQVRTSLSTFDPAAVIIDSDGPLRRVSGGHRGFVTYHDLAGLAGADLDALIDRTVAYFVGRGEPFEWKTYAHDEPADLTERLSAAGFVAEDAETVLIRDLGDAQAGSRGPRNGQVGEAMALADQPALPAGLEIVPVTDRAGYDAIGALQSEVWGEDLTWLADDLDQRAAADPDGHVVLAALADGRMVCAAWLVFNPGTEFAGLYGGSTLAAYRGRGIYRALVSRRARLAVERGVRYLQVDASPDSAPILQRLGFTAITRTTPYVFTP